MKYVIAQDDVVHLERQYMTTQMRWFAAATGVVVVAGLYQSVPKGDPTHEIFAAHNVALMRSCSEMSVMLIDGSVALDRVDHIEYCDEYPIVRDLGAVDKSQTSEFMDILLDTRSYDWSDGAVGCILIPGVRVAFSDGRRRIDILFCFECEILTVYVDGDPFSGADFTEGRGRIAAWFARNFRTVPELQWL